MPRSPRQPSQLAGKIFRGADVVAAGLVTKEDLRSTAWRRLFRGVYADAQIVLTYRLRCKAALRFVSPPRSALAGATVVHLYGGHQADVLDDVVVLVPPGSRLASGDGIRAYTGALDPEDLRFLPLPCGSEGLRRTSLGSDRGGLPRSSLGSDQEGLRRTSSRGLLVTSPERTCWDVARWAEVIEAVVLIDTLLAKGITSIPVLREYALARSDRRGWRQLLRVCELADPGAESPPESRVRVRLVLAGVPKPQTQYEIRRDGRFIARVDMAWPAQKVAVEYDGAWHDSPGQFDKDRARLNKLVAEGWLILHLTAKRARSDFPAFTAELKSALRSRS